MTTSELIVKLTQVQLLHGDLPVEVSVDIPTDSNIADGEAVDVRVESITRKCVVVSTYKDEALSVNT